MTEESSTSVDVDGGALRVAAWGSGPVVLGLHGITASSASWRAVARHLAPERTLLAPDLRGRGGSAALPGPYGIGTHADDCAAVLESVGSEPVTVVGHSMGAFVAVVLAARRPELVERLVLVDGGLPLPVPDGIDVDAVLEGLLGPSLARLRLSFDSPAAYREYWKAHPALGPYWNDDVETFVDEDLDAATLRSKVSEQAVRADGRDTLENARLISGSATALRCPVTLLRAPRNLADEPTPLLPDALVEHWRGVLPQLVDEVVDDVNHYTILFDARAAAVVAARAVTAEDPAR